MMGGHTFGGRYAPQAMSLLRIVAALIFFVLGLILLSPELLAQWPRNGSGDGELLGMPLPIPAAGRARHGSSSSSVRCCSR